MKYCSTCGEVQGWTFEQALFSTGFVRDGGLLMPETTPQITQNTLQQWRNLSFVELAKEIIPLFISEDEIPRKDLNGLLDKAFSKFSCSEVVKVAKLKNELKIAELWHGKTLAFKDLAMFCTGQFLEYFLNKRKKHVTIVVATSGDTGSSAIESIRGLKWVDIIVLLPKGRITKIQELMMTTVLDDNVHVMAGENTTSDGLDDVTAVLYNNETFKEAHNLCTLNSINWARVMVQMVHYFYAYLHITDSCDQIAEIIVPTGAAGNISAGCLASFMGLPIRIVSTVNSNDIMFRTLQNGDYSMSNDVIPTWAPAMDIQVPYNLQRMIWLFSNKDTQLVSKLMKQFQKEGKFMISQDLLQKMNSVITSYTVNDPGILATMKKCWHDNQYLLCPHTAVAVTYFYDKRVTSDESMPSVCLATASPAKFPEAVLEAGLTPQPTPEVEALESMPTKYLLLKDGEDWVKIIKERIEQITAGRANLV
ncbi:threonine synthase-like 2 [Saccoglossus kowalevskii]|uniref:Threonine synthase-like 2 n=1 Tax=Saccoglossus kowalevskii TaxID=10224 RepID=A0ABM0MAX0_SACKO|nr:PREDICTED: threonine synthase-like 2-like [Saccoglossus kowalevskii]